MKRRFSVGHFYRHTPSILISCALVLLIVSLVMLRGGMLHPEAHRFIPHYLSPHPLLQKIFDPHETDFDMYQARELSYLFDFVDCRAIAASIHAGMPHFLSLSHYLFAALAGALLWHIARRQLALPAPLAGLVVLLYFSTPAVMLGGSFFRSAKAGVAVSILAVAVCLGTLWRAEEKRPQARWLAALAVALLMMGTFDRQGFFLVLVVGVLQCIRAVRDRSPRERTVFVTVLSAVLLLLSYNYILAPALISSLNGYQPSFRFQQIDFGQIIHDRSAAVRLLIEGPQLGFKYAGLLLGGVAWPLAALAIVAAIWQLAPQWPVFGSAPESDLTKRGWWTLLLLALMAMTGLMSLQLASILLPELTLTYYALPCIAIFAIGLALALRALRHRLSLNWRMAGMAALVASNLLSLHDRKIALHRGMYGWSYDNSPALLQTLRGPALGSPPLTPGDSDSTDAAQAAAFLRYLQSLR